MNATLISSRMGQRITVVAAVALGGVVGIASPASAHVTVHSDEPVRGASDAAIMFRTPNEENHASTVKLQVFFPTDHPLLGVLVEPHDGWHFLINTAALATPVRTDDGQITSAVSEVTWTADKVADGLQPAEASDFVVIAGQLPSTPSVIFRALQTYSNGDVVRWIETPAPGAEEPEHPAPVLQLAASSGDGTSMDPVPATGDALTATRSTPSSGTVNRGLALAALVVAIIAAGLGVVAVRRRPA